MKISLVLIVAFFSLSSVRSQEVFLGKSKKYITDSLRKIHYFPERIGRKVEADSKSPIMSLRPDSGADIRRENAGFLEFKYEDFEYFDTKTYLVKNGDTTGYVASDTTHLSLLNFLMKNDTCFRFYEFLERHQLQKTFEYLNSKYKRIDDNHWVDQTGIYEAVLDTKFNDDPLPDDMFIIQFKKKGSIQYKLKLDSDL